MSGSKRIPEKCRILLVNRGNPQSLFVGYVSLSAPFVKAKGGKVRCKNAESQHC